jgi:hypothetical protein
MSSSDRFQTALAGFDAANSEDPNKEPFEGKEYPKELIYSQRLSACLEQFQPDASEVLKLAIRAQHIQRWKIPRKDYPMDRPGYHNWKNTLRVFHADTAGKIMLDAGYDEDTIKRVQTIIRKERLKQDPEVQALEDVVDLVFVQFYLEAFAKQYENDPEKLIDIVRKTWKKMSDKGHEAALKLPIPEHLMPSVVKAISE